MYFQTNRFCEKAFPEPLFRYFSNLKAFLRSLNEINVINSKGSLVLVNLTFPF